MLESVKDVDLHHRLGTGSPNSQLPDRQKAFPAQTFVQLCNSDRALLKTNKMVDLPSYYMYPSNLTKSEDAIQFD